MQIHKNFSLKDLNTFGIDAKARHFTQINSVDALAKALQLDDYPEKFIISGGSNMLLTKDIDALVLHINMKGITVVEESEDEVVLSVMAGENWHQLVLWTLEKGYGGLENMSLIPGNTGTAPIQNIGAYGVELKDVFLKCEAMHMATQVIKTFSKSDCNFGYRDSYFKQEGKGKYIITKVYFTLSKSNHTLNTSYGAIEGELITKGITAPTIKEISNAVIAIRQQKLPDPKVLGNSGSFFKNPIIPLEEFTAFSDQNENAPYYKVSEDAYKIPAGWLIEQCGYKGKRFGDAGVHKNQALVLVNYGNASGQELLNLSKEIQKAVLDKFGIRIQAEVNII